jgi:hypothetical protein
VISIPGAEEDPVIFTEVYQGETDPGVHADSCIKKWRREGCPEQYWTQKFIHTLGPIPKA